MDCPPSGGSFTPFCFIFLIYLWFLLRGRLSQANQKSWKNFEQSWNPMHTDSFWHFPPLLNGTWSSGLLFECPDLQSYFDLWVITDFNLHLLLPSRVPLTFHLSKHTLADLFLLLFKIQMLFKFLVQTFVYIVKPARHKVEHVVFHLLPPKCKAQLNILCSYEKWPFHENISLDISPGSLSIRLYCVQSMYTQQWVATKRLH